MSKIRIRKGFMTFMDKGPFQCIKGFLEMKEKKKPWDVPWCGEFHNAID